MSHKFNIKFQQYFEWLERKLKYIVEIMFSRSIVNITICRNSLTIHSTQWTTTLNVITMSGPSANGSSRPHSSRNPTKVWTKPRGNILVLVACRLISNYELYLAIVWEVRRHHMLNISRIWSVHFTSIEAKQPISFSFACEVSHVLKQPMKVEQLMQDCASNRVISFFLLKKSTAMDFDDKTS